MSFLRWKLKKPSCRHQQGTLAKQQLGLPSGQATLLDLSWAKNVHDVIKIEIPSRKAVSMKRGILGIIAQIYEALGLIYLWHYPENISFEIALTRSWHGTKSTAWFANEMVHRRRKPFESRECKKLGAVTRNDWTPLEMRVGRKSQRRL